ncbi:MAG: SOS response-associated peptidase [Candidatus Tectomicrobia bacterium]|uniref:Abasic site processing protein n=1 Tax=Tectimicrobiota bacterium TaxID=2528274 RepID=A0A933GL30_UNCTE|nr:SOS response-associated peptidase [Candidatus Tectomicrobia bacterium]
MCGRFTLFCEIETICLRFKAEKASVEIGPRYNIAPNNIVLAIVNGTKRQLKLFRWGLIPSWAKEAVIGHKMINARAETLATKPSFKKALRKQRCLILADGFYEWRKEGRNKWPVYYQLKSTELFAFAGLWDSWTSAAGDRIESCTIITTESNSLVAEIHDRMPVILASETEDYWLDSSITDSEEIITFLKPYPAELMQSHEVSRLVNSPAYDGPECIKPLTNPT